MHSDITTAAAQQAAPNWVTIRIRSQRNLACWDTWFREVKAGRSKSCTSYCSFIYSEVLSWKPDSFVDSYIPVDFQWLFARPASLDEENARSNGYRRHIASRLCITRKLHFAFISLHVFPSKNKKRITDRCCFFLDQPFRSYWSFWYRGMLPSQLRQARW